MGRNLAAVGFVLVMASVLTVRRLGDVSLIAGAVGAFLAIVGLVLWAGDKGRRERRLEAAKRQVPEDEGANADATGRGVVALGVEVSSRWGLAARRLLAAFGVLFGIQVVHSLSFEDTGTIWTAIWGLALLALFLRDRAAMPLPTPNPRYEATRVRVESDELVLGAEPNERRLPLVSRRSGFVARTDEGAITTLWLGSRVVFAHMPSAESAYALLRAAGAAPEQRVVEVALVPRVLRKVGSWIAMLLLFPLIAIPLVVLGPLAPEMSFDFAVTLLMVFGVCYLAVLCWRHSRLPTMAIGADGIDVHGALPNRFVRYEEIDAVSSATKAVRITLTDGESIELQPQLMVMPNMAAAERAAAKMIAGQIQLNLDQHREAAGAMAQRMHEFERRGRQVEDWLDGVSRLAQSSVGYRSGFLDVEHLERVVTDPNESPDRRIGASVALARIEDPGSVDRARIAVGRIAQAPLRRAIERALEGELELEAIEEATAESAGSTDERS